MIRKNLLSFLPVLDLTLHDACTILTNVVEAGFVTPAGLPNALSSLLVDLTFTVVCKVESDEKVTVESCVILM
jgi:hypothetical protein